MASMNKGIAYALVLLCCIPLAVFAGSATLTFTAPTSNVDGSPIPASGADSLASYKAEWGTCSGSGFGTAAGSQSLPLMPLSATLTNIAPGLTCFRMYAINAAGVSSGPTNAVSVVVQNTSPTPVTLVAYKMRQAVDSFTFVAIGTIAPGTVCGTQNVDGYSIIPRSSVTLKSKFDTLPLITFAVCA